MSFKAEERTLDKLLNDARYLIPRNQRRYVWGKQNWSELFEDISLVANGVASSHFIGSIVLNNEGKEDGLSIYTVIDGQQRIITLTLLLSAIMFTFAHHNMTDDFGGMKKFLISNDIKNKTHSIVDSEYHQSLRKIVEVLTDSKLEEMSKTSLSSFIITCTVSKSKDSTIINAFKYFCETLIDTPKDCLVKIRDATINIGYVNIITSSEEDSYTIFEILNARGLDLEDYELLKNFIMRFMQPEARRDDAKAIWEEMEHILGENLKNFIKHYTTHKFETSKNKRDSNYKIIQHATDPKKVEDLLLDMRKKTDYFSKIISTPKPDGDNVLDVEFKVFTFFKRKRHEQWRPILLSLQHQKELGKMTTKQYISTLQFLYNYYVCFKIIGEENSNRLEDVTYKYAPLLENNFSDKVLDEFVSNLQSKIPGLDWFTNAFKNVGWSNHWGLYEGQKGKERVQITLEVIEEYISGRSLNMQTTIEHILPDSASIENAQIGNLLLLEEKLNRKCKDRPIDEKINIYQESALVCPHRFAKRYNEKEFIPSSRTEFLATFVYNNILQLRIDPNLSSTIT